MNIIGKITINSENSLITFRRHVFQMLIALDAPRPKSAQLCGLISQYINSYTSDSNVEIYLQQNRLVLIFKNFTGDSNIFANVFHTVSCENGLIKACYSLPKDVLLDESRKKSLKALFLEKTVEELLLEVEEQNKALAVHGQQLESKVQERTKEAEQARIQAEAANKAKSQFISNMSHELRTPLNGVLGYTQALLNDSELQTKHQNNLRGINSCGEHLLTVINDILDISKIEAGKMELLYEVTNIQQLLNETTDIVKHKAQEKGLAISLKISDGVSSLLNTGPTKVRQILVNLVGNAVKFTPAGSITISLEQKAKMLLFKVKDSGIGIPENKLKSIFEPFKQDKGGHREGGTGLGLAICMKIIEALGGEIGVDSVEGQGSTFWFTHPANIEASEVLTDSSVTIGDPDSMQTIISIKTSEHLLPIGFKLSTDVIKKLKAACEIGDLAEIEIQADYISKLKDGKSVADFILEKANSFDFDQIDTDIIQKMADTGDANV